MAVIHARRRMVPMTSSVWRVGCKKSVPKPKRKNWLSLKKEFLERIEDELQILLQPLHQKTRDEMISAYEKEQEEVAAETGCSAEANADVQDMPLQQDTTDTQGMSLQLQHTIAIPAEGGHLDLQDMHLQHNTAKIQLSSAKGGSDLEDMPLQHCTAKTQSSAKGGISDLQDMPPQSGTALIDFSVEGCHSDLQDMPFPHDTTGTQFLVEEGNSHILDTPLQNKAAAIHFSANGDKPELGDVPVQHGTAGTHFSAGGGESDLKETSLQYDTAMTEFSAEESETYVPDTYDQYEAAEGSNDVQRASEGVSRVNKWACRVCKSAEVSIAVLPCRHLCLCLDCEPETDKCPVCGGSKDQCFQVTHVS